MAAKSGNFPAGKPLRKKNSKIEKKMLSRPQMVYSLHVMKTHRTLITAIIAILFGAAIATQAEAARRNNSTPPPTVGGGTMPVSPP